MRFNVRPQERQVIGDFLGLMYAIGGAKMMHLTDDQGHMLVFGIRQRHDLSQWAPTGFLGQLATQFSAGSLLIVRGPAASDTVWHEFGHWLDHFGLPKADVRRLTEEATQALVNCVPAREQYLELVASYSRGSHGYRPAADLAGAEVFARFVEAWAYEKSRALTAAGHVVVPPERMAGNGISLTGGLVCPRAGVCSLTFLHRLG